MSHPKGSQANTFHRDVSRAIELHPQTGHKVVVIDEYYGQFSEILVAASKIQRIDASHIWLIEVCAGAGTYVSTEHHLGYVDGCALRACAKAREIQRKHPDVTMHVVLVEPDANHCADLSKLVREYSEGSGRGKVDVKIEPARFEDCVEKVLRLTARIDGGYYHSLWFLDPDGIKEIPHNAVEHIASAGRGPEIIINLSATGLARVKDAAMPRQGSEGHAYVAGNRRLMNTLFGGDSWQAITAGSAHAIYLSRLASAYADTFPKFAHRRIYKLRSNGDEVRYLVHLSHSPKAVDAFERTYKRSQQIGLQKGNKLTEPERANYAKTLVERFPRESLTIEEIHVEFGGRLNRMQIAAVCRYANMKGYGSFDDASKTLTLNAEQQILVERHLPAKSAADSSQISLF